MGFAVPLRSAAKPIAAQPVLNFGCFPTAHFLTIPERHAKGKGFSQSRPSLWTPILRSLFSRLIPNRARSRLRRGRCPHRPVGAVSGLLVFSASAGVMPSGGLFFPLVRKEEEERHAKGKGFLQSRPSLWNPFLRGLFSSRALRCRARCLAPLGPRNRGAAGSVRGWPARRISLWIRGNNPTCHSERSEESCRKLALDSSSLRSSE